MSVAAGTVTAGIFLINGIVNGLVNIFNGHKQRSVQESLSKETMEMQRENMLMQLEQQRRLHRDNNRTAIANQLRTYRLTKTWPLSTAPDDIAKLAGMWDKIPLCFIVAPIEPKFNSVIMSLRDTILNEFQGCGDAPVIQYGYAPNVSVNPSVDIYSIYAGLKNFPVLYIAPSLVDNKSLKITIAFWGLGGYESPATTTMTIDIRKLYVDQLRDDAKDYKGVCDKGELIWDDKLPSANNYGIFQKENLELGFDRLDNQGFYNKLQACSNTLEKIGDRLLPFMTVFSVALIDMYNVLVRSTTPRLPKYLNKCKCALPDLRVKQLDGTVNTIKKEEYVERLCCTYVEYIANYSDVMFCQKLIPVIKEMGENYGIQMESAVGKRIENKENFGRRNNEVLNRRIPNESSFDKARKYLQQFYRYQESDYAKALTCLKKAADYEYLDALYVLADEYRKNGQYFDMEKTYVRGAQLGDQRAVKQLKQLKKG